MNFIYTLGGVLRTMRGANRLKSKVVSTKLDIPETTLLSYERDTAIPTHCIILGLAALYGVPQGILFWFAQESLTPVDEGDSMYEYHQKVREMMQGEVDLYETAIINKLTASDAEKYPEQGSTKERSL